VEDDSDEMDEDDAVREDDIAANADRGGVSPLVFSPQLTNHPSPFG